MRRLGIIRAVLVGIIAASFPLAPVVSATTPIAPTLLTHLKTKGATEIDRRVQNLQGALDKLSKSTTLKSADLQALTKQLNDEIAGLNQLKTKLAGETTVAAARTDVASIVSDYRVYVLMLPKARMTASADRFDVVEQKLTDLEEKLQAKVTSARNSGTNTASMQASLDDMLAKIADAKAKSASLVSQLLALAPTDYNQNHSVLASYRASMKTSHSDLVAARDDAKSVMAALGITGPSVSPNPSTSPSHGTSTTPSAN